jgi:hypothetical protein
MDLNPFGNYFTIFATLCMAYAGSESFRYSLDVTILRLGVKIDELKKYLEEQKALLTVQKSEPPVPVTREEYSALASKIINFDELVEEEADFRGFPIALKSMFYMTSLFCFAVIVLTGYSQFFKCSEVTFITLTALNFVLIYNLVIFWRSYRRNACKKPIPPWLPTLVFLCLCLAVTIYVNSSPWLSAHCATHPENDPNRFQHHAQIFDERWMITAALLIAASPFVLHYFRVRKHSKQFMEKFENMKSSFEAAKRLSRQVDELTHSNTQEDPISVEVVQPAEKDEREPR